MSNKLTKKQKIRFRIRKKVAGTATKPRLSVFRSNSALYLQLINDDDSVTITSASTKDKAIAAQSGTKSEKSKLAGLAIGQKAIDLGIKEVVFDRGGNLYHGRIKAAAEGAREAGLQF